MLTDNKEITTPAYWDSLYKGERNNAKVDSSNGVRTSTFDRFGIVVNHVHEDEKLILGIASGHAHIEKGIKAKCPQSLVIASDQAEGARKAANYIPYIIINAYNITYPDKHFDLIICTQAMEYMEFPDRFLAEAKRVSKKFLCTVPLGNMSNWTQLRLYDEENFKEFLEKYGTIEVFEVYESLMLAKIKFYG